MALLDHDRECTRASVGVDASSAVGEIKGGTNCLVLTVRLCVTVSAGVTRALQLQRAASHRRTLSCWLNYQLLLFQEEA